MRCEHGPIPESYLAWTAIAQHMSKTHRQVRCPWCGLFAIWEPKPPSKAAVNAVIRQMERNHE